MTYARTAHDITNGLPDDAFRHLSGKDKARLVKLMARLAERSYRRGFQHGAVAKQASPALDACGVEIYDWRYGRVTDQCPIFGHPGFSEAAIGRLFMENRGLRGLGFDRHNGPQRVTKGNNVPSIGNPPLIVKS